MEENNKPDESAESDDPKVETEKVPDLELPAADDQVRGGVPKVPTIRENG